MRHASTTRSRSRGHTLLELVVVLTIISAAAAVAMPRLSAASTRHRLDLASRRVTADLRLAARHAKASQTPWVVEFEPATLRYWVRPQGGAPVLSVDLREDPYRLSGIAAGSTASLVGGRRAITFDRFGAPTSAVKLTISAGGVNRSFRTDIRAPGLIAE